VTAGRSEKKKKESKGGVFEKGEKNRKEKMLGNRVK